MTSHFTRIPACHKAELAHIQIEERKLGEESPSIAELMYQLRLKFQKDDEELSTKLFHYNGPLFVDSDDDDRDSSQDASRDAVDCRPVQTCVHLPTPARPDPKTLAKLLEVSSTEWSDLSDQDTTADSKLAVWLASFAPSNPNLTHYPENITTTPSKSKVDQTDSSIYDDEPSSSFAFHLSKLAPPGHTPWKPGVSQSAFSRRRRALSDPGTPCPKSPFLTTLDSEASFVDASLSRNSGDSHVSYHSAPSSQIRFFPPFDFELHPQPSVMTQLNPELLDPSLAIPNTPTTPELQTPNTVDGFNSPLQGMAQNKAHHRQLLTGRVVRFQGVNDSQSMTIPEASIVNSLYDISDTYAFNLALKHTSKSPHLVRNWKRVVQELAGRFPFEIGTQNDGAVHHFGDISGNSEAEDDKSPVASSTPILHLDNDISPTSHGTEQPVSFGTSGDTSIGIHTSSKSSTKDKRTIADAALDREYTAHLRKSIERKETEIKALVQLIVQRDATIARLRDALKKKELEILRLE